MFESSIEVYGLRKVGSRLRNFVKRFAELVSNEMQSAPSVQGAPSNQQVEQNPFWHYQCAFDAQATMARYAAPELMPSAKFLTNYLGVKIDPRFFPQILMGRENTVETMPQPNNWHADIAEFAAALRAVDLAGPTFTVLELGCGWGCWLNNTGAAARRAGKSVKLLGVEGDLGHVGFAKTSLVTNGYKPKEYEILHGVAAATSGKALFPKQPVPGLAWGLEPLFGAKQDQIDKALRDETHYCLEMIGLGEIVHRHGKLDLLHIDIQGGEADFVSDSIELCNSFVRYIVIGTHSRVIEGTLEKLLLAHGWILEVDRPAIVQLQDSKQILRVDGVQGWKNPRKI